jgi:protein gp37
MPEQYAQRFDTVQVMEGRFDEPKHWKQPQVVLVSSQGDLFHKDVPDEALDRIFEVMESEERHLFLVLTKRAKRMAMYFNHRSRKRRPAENIWAGVSIENQAAAEERMGYLLSTHAGGHWVSAEPLIGPVDLGNVFMDGLTWKALRGTVENTFNGDGEIQVAQLDFVAAGGENGVGSRPCHPDWARKIRNGCHANGVKFWWKGWGPWAPFEPFYGATDSVVMRDTNMLVEHIDEIKEKIKYEKICMGNDGFVSERWFQQQWWDSFDANPYKNPWWMLRLGKKAAGRQLDAQTWEQGPR